MGDALRGGFGRDVEVDPPHGHGGAEGGNHRRDDRDSPREAGEGRASDEKRFAEGDDDEEPAAFGEMGAFDRPIGDRRASELREPEAHGGANVFDRQGGNPEAHAERVMREGAGDPEDAGERQPERDAGEVQQECTVFAAGVTEKCRAADLDGHIWRGESEPPAVEGFGN